jgi:hypothetical protein
MATDDTISGQVRYVLEDTQGNRNIVFGSVPQAQLDYTNRSPNADEKTYVNTRRSSKVAAPAGAKTRSAPNAVVEAGEKLIVQHKASASVTNDINLDRDSFSLEGVTVDLNRDNSFIDVLDQSDQELSGSVGESTSEFVDMYQYTVPDRQRFLLAGEQEAAATEN